MRGEFVCHFDVWLGVFVCATRATLGHSRSRKEKAYMKQVYMSVDPSRNCSQDPVLLCLLSSALSEEEVALFYTARESHTKSREACKPFHSWLLIGSTNDAVHFPPNI